MPLQIVKPMRLAENRQGLQNLEEQPSQERYQINLFSISEGRHNKCFYKDGRNLQAANV